MLDGVEVLTRVLCSANDHIESKTELYSGNCIQDARDPFALLRYRVSPAMIEEWMSSFKSRNEVKPLSQDNLGKDDNGCIVHDSNESGSLASVP